MKLTVVSVTGINAEAHWRAIKRTQEALPFDTRYKLIYRPGMDLNEYSRYMVKDLRNDIETDFALICQPDGYGLRPELWSESFLEFDYLGAPFPNGEVGNGGLSIRSRAFLEHSASLADPPMPEDSWLCQYRRCDAEDRGIRFGDTRTALRFSYEHPVEGFEWNPELSWGFHGSWNIK